MGSRAGWALILLCACGPIRSTSWIVDAQAELAAAKNANSMRVAPYESTAAEQYLHKAREEQSYSEFEHAEYLARKAHDCARYARRRAELAANAEMGGKAVTDSSLSNKGCAPVYDGVEADPTPSIAVPVVEPKKDAPAKKKAAEPAEPKDPAPPEGG